MIQRGDESVDELATEKHVVWLRCEVTADTCADAERRVVDACSGVTSDVAVVKLTEDVQTGGMYGPVTARRMVTEWVRP